MSIFNRCNLIKAMVDQNKTLSELSGIMKVFPQVLINVTVKDKAKYNNNKRIQDAIVENQALLGKLAVY